MWKRVSCYWHSYSVFSLKMSQDAHIPLLLHDTITTATIPSITQTTNGFSQ